MRWMVRLNVPSTQARKGFQLVHTDKVIALVIVDLHGDKNGQSACHQKRRPGLTENEVHNAVGYTLVRLARLVKSTCRCCVSRTTFVSRSGHDPF
jgi:hypothetical protein